jgi:hypothetical protein
MAERRQRDEYRARLPAIVAEYREANRFHVEHGQRQQRVIERRRREMREQRRRQREQNFRWATRGRAVAPWTERLRNEYRLRLEQAERNTANFAAQP